MKDKILSTTAHGTCYVQNQDVVFPLAVFKTYSIHIHMYVYVTLINGEKIILPSDDTNQISDRILRIFHTFSSLIFRYIVTWK